MILTFILLALLLYMSLQVIYFYYEDMLIPDGDGGDLYAPIYKLRAQDGLFCRLVGVNVREGEDPEAVYRPLVSFSRVSNGLVLEIALGAFASLLFAVTDDLPFLHVKYDAGADKFGLM